MVSIHQIDIASHLFSKPLTILKLRFDLSPNETGLTSARTTHIVNSLHAILKPFLLRRLKVDVETGLPPQEGVS